MTKRMTLRLTAAVCLALAARRASAAGISVDAGLTPPEDRWIFRTQVRHMGRTDDPTPMNRRATVYMFPTVVAYGLRPELTLLARQAVVHRRMNAAGMSTDDTGFGDLFVLGKYRLYRRNTRNMTLGAAATLGLELPTGSDEFTSDTWDLEPGVFFTWRRGSLSADASAAYKWNGFSDHGTGGIRPGGELSLDLALAYQFTLDEAAATSLAPVLELSYEHVAEDKYRGSRVADTGESIVYLSPGLKLTVSSFILEALARFPVTQDQKGNQPERRPDLILGVRILF